MNQFGGYEGTDNNDQLLDRLVPKIGRQARAIVEKHNAAPDLVLVVVFLPLPECRAARLDDVIAMMERRGETKIAETLRTEQLEPGQHWLAIQRYEEGGGVIVMARLQFGDVDVGKLLH